MPFAERRQLPYPGPFEELAIRDYLADRGVPWAEAEEAAAAAQARAAGHEDSAPKKDEL